MTKTLSAIFFLSSIICWGQTDYSDSWEDHYSYNDVKDFYINSETLIGLTDNAFFNYSNSETSYKKTSSVNGLIGDTTSAFYYDDASETTILGYENGTVEIIKSSGEIILKPDIKNFSIIGSKKINHFKSYGSDLYISTDFGLVVFNLEELDFKSTLYIGEGSTQIVVNETEIHDGSIYAATENGIYYADISNPFLQDYNNWSHVVSDNITNLCIYQDEIYLSISNKAYHFQSTGTLALIKNMPSTIHDITTNGESILIITKHQVTFYNTSFDIIDEVVLADVPYSKFNTNTAQIFEDNLYIATEDNGVLVSKLDDLTHFNEIHPAGPISNKLFSISVLNKDLWVVYGAYNSDYAPLYISKGASHFDGENWINIPYDLESGIPVRGSVQVTIDPMHENKVYVSTYGNGIYILENNTFTTLWDTTNSGLEALEEDGSIRVGGTALDDNGNLWVSTTGVPNWLKKYNTKTGAWSNYNLSSIHTVPIYGTNHIIIDKTGNKWMGTNGNGALVINENGSRKLGFKTNVGKGSLPDAKVNTIAVDHNNRIWMGTKHGMVTFNSSASFFNQATYDAKPIVLAYGDDDGFGEALLGDQTINSIMVDGADNKWFGTKDGVLQTNSSGQETLATFNVSNSPLPSNNVKEIQFDASTGKVYFATDKGLVSYNSNISNYGEHLVSAYAYPNPVKRQHDFVTIDGRNDNHLPNGTNVKILDIAGKLVFETNVREGQEQYGGKVVWDKTNLAGTKVASGIYMVLLTTKDGSESVMTKIAIIN